MLVYIHGKNIDITAAMHNRIEAKLQFMDKYFELDDSFRANVIVKTHRPMTEVEITIHTKFGILRAEVEHEDFYAALDIAVDKLEDQIRRQKTKLSKKNRESQNQLKGWALPLSTLRRVGFISHPKNTGMSEGRLLP